MEDIEGACERRIGALGSEGSYVSPSRITTCECGEAWEGEACESEACESEACDGDRELPFAATNFVRPAKKSSSSKSSSTVQRAPWCEAAPVLSACAAASA